jgi:hypothetical protein
MHTQLFFIPDSKAYQRSKFQPNTMSYEGDMIFQRWQCNSASKQVSWRNESKLRSEASKPISKFLFQQFSSSKSKLEDFMQGYWLCIKSIIKSLILHMYLLFLFGFFIIIDVLFSNEVSFNVSIGFWSLNELFQKIQRRNSEQRIEEKFSWRLKKILVQISAPNLLQKSILFQF